MRQVAAFFYSFFTERNSCELHMEDEVNKSSDAQHHSTANISNAFSPPPMSTSFKSPQAQSPPPPPTARRGNRGLCMQRSLDQTLPTMCNSLQSKECDSSSLTRSAFHHWLSHTTLSSFSNLCGHGANTQRQSLTGKRSQVQQQELLQSVLGQQISYRKVKVCLEEFSDSTVAGSFLLFPLPFYLLIQKTEYSFISFPTPHPS